MLIKQKNLTNNACFRSYRLKLFEYFWKLIILQVVWQEICSFVSGSAKEERRIWQSDRRPFTPSPLTLTQISVLASSCPCAASCWRQREWVGDFRSMDTKKMSELSIFWQYWPLWCVSDFFFFFLAIPSQRRVLSPVAERTKD